VCTQLGAAVIGIDRQEPKAALAGFIGGDLSSQGGIDAIVAKLPQRFDALCNIAGLSGAPGAAPTVAVNFYGLRALSEAVAGKIREGGAIVSVASIAGYGWRANLNRAKSMLAAGGFPDVAAVLREHNVAEPEGYPLSKELLLLWTQLAAHQPMFKSRGIRIVSVSPGPVETPILGQFRQVFGDQRVDSDIAAAGRAGNPSDIAPVIAFLCSDGARWINGANIAADGGLEAAVNAQALGF
jgi:NAD(P)-dependent dehydrogenase (short-subunit alcohol dehydrogenase family)